MLIFTIQFICLVFGEHLCFGIYTIKTILFQTDLRMAFAQTLEITIIHFQSQPTVVTSAYE